MAVLSANSAGILVLEVLFLERKSWDEGTLSEGTPPYASGGMSISSAVVGNVSMISGFPRPTVVLALAVGVFSGVLLDTSRRG